jgi:hypothetical protein
LYVGLNKPVQINRAPRNGAYISRVNVPAAIDGSTVTFKVGGMMQLVVSGGLSHTVSDGWTVTQVTDGTMYTKYGEPCELVLVFG